MEGPHSEKLPPDFDTALPGSVKDQQPTANNVNLNISLSGESKIAMAARIGLNDNKAGMEGLDKERINQIIMEASKGSKFYENELKKDKITSKKIEALKHQLSEASSAQLTSCRNKADNLIASLYTQYDFSRYIVHMDMDAFYAAVEMRDNPSLRDIPMAVGGEGMLSTSNYAARRFGVRAAMPGFIARKLCPQLVIVPTNFKQYTATSMVCRKILLQYDPNMSPMSLDEAYIDFTNHMKERHNLSEEARTFPQYCEDMCRCEPEYRRTQPSKDAEQSDDEANSKNSDDGDEDKDQQMKQSKEETKSAGVDGICTEEIADEGVAAGASRCPTCDLSYNTEYITYGLEIEDAVDEMRHRIHLRTKLTASAGIAPNCLIAKICSDMNKPNGQYRLPFSIEAMQEFMKDLPIRKVPGIGKVSEKQLVAFDILTCKDFYKQRDKLAFLYSGGSFEYFMSIYMGIGSNVVQRNDDGPKSKSVERTFRTLSDPAELQNMCYDLSMDLAEDLKAAELTGKTVTLKIKLETFELKTRAQSLPSITNDGEEIYKVASALLKTEIHNAHPKSLKLRLMGVRMSNFASADSRQSKLPTTRKQGAPSSDGNTNKPITSFFDMIDKENKSKAKVAEPEPLGLLAYMTDYNPISNMSNDKKASDKPKPAQGLDRYSLKRKNVWDDVDRLPPNKQPKSGTKGTVTICSLLDNSSSSDAWSVFENSLAKQAPPNASTPHVPKAVSGPLDNFWDADSITNPWREICSEQQAQSAATEQGGSKITAKPMESYFTKTKSVWAEYEQPSEDDDIVCISETPKPKLQPEKRTTKTRGQGKNKKGTKPLSNMFQAGPSRSTSQESVNSRRTVIPRKVKQTIPSSNIEPYDGSGCEVITIDSD